MKKAGEQNSLASKTNFVKCVHAETF